MQASNPGLLDSLSFLLVSTDRLEEAGQVVDQWLQVKADDIGAMQRKALILIRGQKYQQAVELLTKILRVQPENSTALINRAISLLQSQRYDEALRDYKQLVEKFPESHEIQFGLGQIQVARKNPQRAIEHFENYLKRAPRETAEYTNVLKQVAELKAKKP